jgi:hypothetical protein
MDMAMDIDGRMLEEEARRFGSLQTEVGGATRAIPGICRCTGGKGRGR